MEKNGKNQKNIGKNREKNQKKSEKSKNNRGIFLKRKISKIKQPKKLRKKMKRNETRITPAVLAWQALYFRPS